TKVNEYRALKPDECQLRLKVTELRWYLVRLMKMPATNRADQLALIPDDTRRLVEERLQQWDNLSPQKQKELLEHEAAIQYLADLARTSPQQQQTNLLNMSEA